MKRKIRQLLFKPWVKKLLRVTLYLMSAFLLLMLIGYGLLQTAVVQETLKKQLIDAVETHTRSRFTLDRLSGNLLGNLSLHDLQLSLDGEDILTVDRIDLAYSLPMLLSKTIWINRLRFDGLRLTAERQPDGSWNLLDVLTDDTSGIDSQPKAFPFQLTVKQLQMTNSLVRIVTASARPAEVYRIDQFDCGLTYRSDGGLDTHIRRMAFSIGSPPLTGGDISGQIRFDPSRGGILEAEALQIRTEASDLILDGKLEVAEQEPKIKADLSLSPLSMAEMASVLRIPDFNRGVFWGEIRVHGSLEEINHRVRLRHQQQVLTLKGVVRRLFSGGLDIDTQGTAAHFDPFYWVGPMEEPPTSDLNFEFDFSGSRLLDSRREGRLIVDLQESVIAGYALTQGGWQADYADTRLEFSDVRLVSPLGRIEAASQLSGLKTGETKRLKARIRLDKTDLGRFWLPDQIDSRITGEIRFDAQGPLDPLTGLNIDLWTAEAEADIHSSMLAGAAIEAVDIRTAWNGRSLSVETLRLTSDMLSADISGFVEPAERTWRLAGDAGASDLQQLSAVLKRIQIVDMDEWAPQGDLNLSATVRRNDQRYRIDADGRSGGLTIAGVSLSDTRLTGRIAFGLSEIDGHLQGSLASLGVQGQKFSELKIDGRLTDQRIATRLTARHELGEFTLSGHLADWQNPVKMLHLNEVHLVPMLPSGPTEEIGDIVNAAPVRVQIRPDGLQIESLSLVSEAGRLAFGGGLEFSGLMKLHLEIEKIRLSRLNAAADRIELPEGHLSAGIDATGTMAQPRLEGWLAFNRSADGDNSNPFIRAAFNYTPDKLSVEAFLEKNDEQLITLKGRNGVQLSFKPFQFRFMDNSLEADVDIAGTRLAELPLPETFVGILDGTVKANVRASGDLYAPQLSGFATLQAGNLNLAAYDLSFNPVSIDLALHPGYIDVKQFKMQGEGDSRLGADGTFKIDGLTLVGFDMHISGQQLDVPYRRAITAQFDPELNLTGSLQRPRIDGRIRIREARINLDRILEQGPSDIEVVGEPVDDQIYEIRDDRSVEDGFFDRLAADLDVVAENNVWLRGQGLDAEINGNIELKKNFQGPARLIGRLEARRGFYDFYGKRFYITEGGVDFNGAPVPDPLVDITAETRIKDVTIVLNLFRENQELHVEMSSRPPMTQSDIISYLVFGRPSDELRTQQSAGSDISALAITGKMAASELERLLAQTGIVDVFTIDPGSDDFISGSASVGKYITRDIFVTYRYQFSEDAPDEIEVDYQLNKNFSLRSQFGEEKTTGVDMIWQHDMDSLNPFSD